MSHWLVCLLLMGHSWFPLVYIHLNVLPKEAIAYHTNSSLMMFLNFILAPECPQAPQYWYSWYSLNQYFTFGRECLHTFIKNLKKK